MVQFIVFAIFATFYYELCLTEAPGERQQGIGHQGQNFSTHFMPKASPIEGILDPKRFCD